jgi:uncharacterized surface protein with fasciclin (FAS1) repeats
MTNRNNVKLGAIAGALGLILAGGALAQNADVSPGAVQPAQSRSAQSAPRARDDVATFDDIARTQPKLSSFVSALKVSGLEKSLADGREYTIFAPTNEALVDKKGKDIDELMEPDNRDELVGFLRAHIVADAIDLQSPRELTKVEALDGETVDLDRKDGEIRVGDAKVVNPNAIDWGNVKIYAIDDVLARGGKSDDAKVSSSNALAPRG